MASVLRRDERNPASTGAPGPVAVYCPPKLGGVRQVTESLALGIEQGGRAVRRVRSLRELLALGLTRQASGAILSLEAGYLAFLFPRSVYILHGFPFVGFHGPLRRVLIRLAARVARRSGARLVAVSHLTRAVHERIYGIPVDRVIFNGCSDALNDHAARGEVRPKRRVVAYVGRLIEVKGIRTLVDAFLASSLPGRGYVLKVAGAGDLAGWVARRAEAGPVELLGEITEAEKERLLLESEAFVSLNDFEPMGVVFVEAALAGCKVVAPYCGGHREFLPPAHPIALCDPADPESVAAAFDEVPRLAPPAAGWSATTFSYQREIAPRYLAVLDGEPDPLAPEREREPRPAAAGGRR